jgi:iron complex transport system ATP-binding protein
MSASSTAPLLEARGLSIAMAGRVLARDVAFAIGPGECWAIVGPNGAGKTTLLRTLAGLLPCAAGVVRYGGDDASALSAREQARRRAYLPQDSHDAFPATVLATVLAGRHPHLARFAWESARDLTLAREALERLGIAALAERDVRELSGGERRRVALAAMLAQDAPLALLDEPSSHLDVAQQALAVEVLAKMTRESGRGLLMVLHDLHLAHRFCDHVIAIGHGGACADRAEAVLNAAALSALFGRALVEVGSDGLRTWLPR